MAKHSCRVSKNGDGRRWSKNSDSNATHHDSNRDEVWEIARQPNYKSVIAAQTLV
jgi:hypothetical protein